MKPTTVTPSNTRTGVYLLIENLNGNGIVLTAQGLLELASWIELHKRPLEQEAQQEPEHRHIDKNADMEDYAYDQLEWRE